MKWLLRVLLASAIALVFGALGIWAFGTSWWSIALAVSCVPAAFWPLLRKDQPEVARG